MNLNYLYHRHGVSLLVAAHAARSRSRHAHHSLAAAYPDGIALPVRETGRL
jgi:hypothetical protein